MIYYIWYDMIWYDMIWYDMIWYDMILYYIMLYYVTLYYILYDIIFYYIIWYDMIWYYIMLYYIILHYIILYTEEWRSWRVPRNGSWSSTGTIRRWVKASQSWTSSNGKGCDSTSSPHMWRRRARHAWCGSRPTLRAPTRWAARCCRSGGGW